MRILWVGDAGCSSGFARVTHEVCQSLGSVHDVDVLAVNYRGELPAWYPGPNYRLFVPTMYNPADTFGISRLPQLIGQIRPDVVVLFNDIAVVNVYLDAIDKSVPAAYRPRVVVYTPVDSTNLPPFSVKQLARADKVITYTRFGVEQLRSAGLDGDIRHAPHGVNHEPAMVPVSFESPALVPGYDGLPVACFSQEVIKKAHGLEGKYVILWVDRNSERKNLAGFLEAVHCMFVLHPDAQNDVVVWLHCQGQDVGGDVRDFLSLFPTLDGKVFITPGMDTFNGVSPEYLAALYNMADLKVSSAMAEGWGLTNCESVLCGTPTIVTDFGPNREVLGDDVDYVAGLMPVRVPAGGRMAYPSMLGMSELIYEHYHKDSKHTDSMKLFLARAHVSQWTWERCTAAIEAAIFDYSDPEVPSLQEVVA